MVKPCSLLKAGYSFDNRCQDLAIEGLPPAGGQLEGPGEAASSYREGARSAVAVQANERTETRRQSECRLFLPVRGLSHRFLITDPAFHLGHHPDE